MNESKRRIRVMENEARMWWIISREGHALKHDLEKNRIKLMELREEAECIVNHSDWPLLRAIIANRIAKFEAAHPGWRQAREAITSACICIVCLV